jgi:triphosphoribosyl-dephospho-CoA synthetase
VDGARAELDLTPKPGLVDRLDTGSHADLSFEAMSRSIDLLPAYFDDLAASAAPLDLAACVAAGQRAERRMVEAVGTNAHKGYIFVAGLALLAAATAADPRTLQPGIAAIARQILGPSAGRPASAAGLSHGERARAEHGLGGIRREALDGLPSVFDHGLPLLCSSGPETPWPAAEAGNRATPYRLMAVLMQTVEDTTAVHRCGRDGLARLRADGVRLQQQIDEERDYRAWLVALNDEYRRINLTMGGVADCMALCFGLHAWLGPPPSPLAPGP